MYIPGESIGLKFIPSQSELFRYLYPSQCESFRTNSKNFFYLVWWKTVKNQSDLIRLIPRDQSEWILTNPKPSFNQSELGLIQTEFLIRINRNRSDLGFIPIDSDWKFDLDQFEIGLNRIDLDWKFGFRLVRIHSDRFGLIRINVSE